MINIFINLGTIYTALKNTEVLQQLTDFQLMVTQTNTASNSHPIICQRSPDGKLFLVEVSICAWVLRLILPTNPSAMEEQIFFPVE